VILYSSSSPRLLLYVSFLLFIITWLQKRVVLSFFALNIEVETIGSSTGTNDEHFTSLERHAKRLTPNR
jgi:hypothetical protein